MSRFTIRRLKGDAGRSTRAPWVMRDASRPAFLGQYATHALAVAAVNAKLRGEHGAPIVDISVAEIREAMTTRRAAREAAKA